MKIDATSIPIHVRSGGECFDLAMAYTREHGRVVSQLTAVFAIPTVAVGFYLGHGFGQTALWQLGLFLAVTPILGAALTLGAGHEVFGRNFTVASALGPLWGRSLTFLVLLVLCRGLTLVTVFVPPLSLYFGVRYGFLTEFIYLERLPLRRLGRRIGLILSASTATLVGRASLYALLFAAVTASLFTLLDRGMTLLFDMPLFFEQLDWTYLGDSLAVALEADPYFAAALAGCGWVTFPLVRLAWFFSYLDVRIRKEGWDLELNFRAEADQLLGTEVS